MNSDIKMCMNALSVHTLLLLSLRQPPTLTILYIYAQVVLRCLSYAPGSHSVCAIGTLLSVDWKILPIRREVI